MKALIIIKDKECQWLRELVSAYHPAMFPLCNKPLLEYYLDFAILCGADEVRFAFESPDDSIEAYFDSGSRWGVKISYSSVKESDQRDDVLRKNSSFSENSKLLIIAGFFFIRFDKNLDYSALSDSAADGTELSCESGEVYLLSKSSQPEILKIENTLDLTVQSITSIRDIFTLTMEILATDAKRYILPGYNNEQGVYIGRNVATPKSVKLTKPVLLGNNVQLGKGCEIGPGAVIGNNVIIDSGSLIERSVILDNTYIGADLTIKEKIVHSNTAISAESGKAFQFVDQHLLSVIRSDKGLSPLGKGVHWSLALIFYAVGILPALLFRFLLVKDANWQQKTNILLAGGSTMTINQSRINNDSVLYRVARGLAMDKVFQLPMVLKGKLDLVGNKPIPSHPEEKEFFDDFAGYLPGVFYFSEAENIAEGDFQEEITERYFAANRSIVTDIKVIFSTFINRWQL